MSGGTGAAGVGRCPLVWESELKMGALKPYCCSPSLLSFKGVFTGGQNLRVSVELTFKVLSNQTILEFSVCAAPGDAPRPACAASMGLGGAGLE